MILKALKIFAKMFLVITVIITIFIYMIALIIGPTLFYFTTEGLNTSLTNLPAIQLLLLNQTIRIPVEINIGLLFSIVWVIFTLSYIISWKLRKNFYKVIKESITSPVRQLFTNNLFGTSIINSMTLIAVIMIQNFQEAGGIPTGTAPLPGDPFLDLLDLSYAAIVEEIGFRFLPIGVFLFVYLIIIRRRMPQSLKQKLKIFFTSILFPDRAKGMFNIKNVEKHGIKGISLGEWGLLILTSIIFGLAHFNPGISWELGKISSAGIAGFVLGLTYLIYGAHASIIMHWFFNSYREIFYLLSQFYPSTVYLPTVVSVISLILGILGWLTIVSQGFLHITRKIQEKEIQVDSTNDWPEIIS